MEMDYKEKYRIALDKAKGIYDGQLGTATRIFLEQIFPELKESEDERIRKELIELVRELSEEPGRGGLTVRRTEMYISYLEKQKEPSRKETPKWMPKFLDELRTKGVLDWDEHKEMEGKVLAIIDYLSPNYFEEKQKDYRKLYKDISQTEWFKQAYEGKSLGEEEKQKEQKPEVKDPFDDEQFRKGYEAGKNDAMRQPRWKPTEEMMEALNMAIEGNCPSPTSYMSRRLEDLYDGLANTYGVEAKEDKQ